jgi:large subunit ribosomal protein L5
MQNKTSTRLYKKYYDEVLPKLKKDFSVENHMALPRIEKVVVNMGVRQAKDDKSIMEEALSEMALIAGQKPIVRRAKKSISNFALREGNPIGCMVTLRGKNMYEFLERLLRIAIPRIRDFGGIKKSFDRFGNLTIGIKDETIFPEVEPDKIKSVKGLSITIVTKCIEKEHSVQMFTLLGFPFVK